MNINGYEIQGELKNANSGFSKWGFAQKNGKMFFIKELISPVYPVDKSIMTEELFSQQRAFSEQFEVKFRKFYSCINRASHGNLVRIEDFFRYGTRYYVVTEKVGSQIFTLDQISSFDEQKKELLLKTLALCFSDLHSAGIVHLDVKPANILIKLSQNGNYIAKLIDFDAGFFTADQPDNQELGGDLTHLAPETFLAIFGEDVTVSEKADIYALGLVFHEFYCGKLPLYDVNEYEYPYEATLDGGTLVLDETLLPKKMAKLIASMLDVDPEKRPSAKEIIAILNNETVAENVSEQIVEVEYVDEPTIEDGPDSIISVAINFNGQYGKSILVTPDKITYNNTLHSTIIPITRNFPPSYTAVNEKEITAEQFDGILTELEGLNMYAIVKPYTKFEKIPGVIYHSLTVSYRSGKIMEYNTYLQPCAEFNNISAYLSQFCEFQEINGSWFEDGGASYVPVKPVTYETVKVEKTSEPEVKKVDEWFSMAGDL